MFCSGSSSAERRRACRARSPAPVPSFSAVLAGDQLLAAALGDGDVAALRPRRDPRRFRAHRRARARHGAVLLRWDDFQPAPDAIDPTMLARLEAVADMAAEAGLGTMPTLFCGHMSGVNLLPAWSLDPSTRHGRFRTIAGEAESPYGDRRLLHRAAARRAAALRARGRRTAARASGGDRMGLGQRVQQPARARERSRRRELEPPADGGARGAVPGSR